MLPPLRERGDDIVELGRTFLERACPEYGLPAKTLAAEACARLRAYPWPGNVRELANVMERVALLADATTVSVAMLGLAPPPAPAGLPAARDAAAGAHLFAALEETGWNISLTARRLDVTRNTVRARIARHELRPGVAPARLPRIEAPPLPPPATAEAAPVAAPAALAADAPARANRAVRPLRWVSRRVTFVRVVVSAGRGDDSYVWSRLVEAFVDKLATFGGRLAGLSPTALLAVFGAEPMEDASRRAAHAAIVMATAVEHARRDDPEVPACGSRSTPTRSSSRRPATASRSTPMPSAGRWSCSTRWPRWPGTTPSR